MKNKKNRVIKNQKGQGLIEYLILVAIIGVSTMWVARILGQNVQAAYANIANALSGNESTKIARVKVEGDQVKKRDLSDFMDGAVGKEDGTPGSKGSKGSRGASGAGNGHGPQEQ